MSRIKNKEVLILPLNLDPLDNTWTIPATVKINEEEFTVVGTPNLCKINVKNIMMSAKIKKFTFGSKFPLAESINFGNAQNLTLGYRSFSGSLLKEVIIPNTATALSIGSDSFSNCESLETFIFPDNITDLSIGKDSKFTAGTFF